MLVTYVYKHNHDCELEGILHEERFTINRGVVYPIHPVCIETLTELELVEVKKDDN